LILVTGASGFLGTHLLKALAHQPLPVRALYNSRMPAYSAPHVTWQSCDLLDIFAVEEVMKGVTKVYNCAAIVSFDPRDHRRMIDANTQASANVVNVMLEQGVGRLLHVSSIAALGRGMVSQSDENALISEETYWEDSKYNSAYAISKNNAEMEVWRGIAEGLNAVIVNPSVILGEGDWSRGSAHLMEIVYNEFPWYTSGVGGWVDVQDVVRAMMMLMDADVQEQRFILNQGNYGFAEMFTKMALALNRKPPFKKASKWMTELLWRVMLLKSRLQKKESTITKETARTAQSKCYYDNSKLLKQFPSFGYTPIDVTISRMAQSFLRDKKLVDIKMPQHP
jgi:dihydroflavonol-4-reductase